VETEEQEKIYHHHTPRYYLLPWTDADERIGWLGFGKIQRSGLTVVGGENHFYRLSELTDRDKELLRQFSSVLSPKGSNIYDRILKVMTVPHDLKRFVEDSDNPDQDLIRKAEIAIQNTNEDKQHEIEKLFRPFLDAMREGDASFYENERESSDFIYSLCVQYFRTKHMKERFLQLVSSPFEDLERVWGILSHMSAASVAAELSSDRDKFKLVLVENATQVPFITSDQPVVNMLADSEDWKAPRSLEFFFPVSPTKALLFLEKQNSLHANNRSISIDEAHRYNMIMIANHGERIFSNSDEYLKHVEQCSAPKR